MLKTLIFIYKITIYYLLAIESTAIILYLRAYSILGRAPENESEEARSFGFKEFID